MFSPDFPDDRKPAIFVVVAAFILMAAVNSGGTLAMWLALLLRPVMHGVSLFKINFLLLFTVICGLVAVLKTSDLDSRQLTFRRRVALGSVCLGMAAGLASFFDTSWRLSLPLNKHVYFFSDGFNSINHFTHIHTTKTGLYYLVNLFGFTSIANSADTGKPLAEYVNPAFALTVLITAAVALIVFLSLAKSVVRQWTGWRQAVALVLYGISASHSIKCLLDGGALTYDFLPSIISTWLLIRLAEGESIPKLFSRTAFRIVLLFVLALVATGAISLSSALLSSPIQYAYFISFLSLFWLLLASPHMARLIALPISVIVLTVSGYYFYTHTAPDILALNQTVASGERVLKLEWSENPSDASQPVFDCLDETNGMVGKPLYEVYRECGENPLRNRNLVVRPVQDTKYNGFLFALRVLKTDHDLELTPDEHVKFSGVIHPERGNDSLFVFRVVLDRDIFCSLWNESPTLRDQNNDYAFYYYLNRYFASKGLSDYILIPLYYQEIA